MPTAFWFRLTLARQRWFERRPARRQPGADRDCQCRATDRVVGTLDSKTSQICRSLDDCGLPVVFGPRPPFHPNGRATFVLSTQFSEMFGQGGTRSPQNGQINGALECYHWLHRQPASFQDAAIGPVRAELFRDGGLTVQRFNELQLNRNFAPLDLA